MKIKRELREYITITCPMAEASDAVGFIYRNGYTEVPITSGLEELQIPRGSYQIKGWRPARLGSRKAKGAA